MSPFTNFAITVNVDVPATYNVQCYFPGWLDTSGFSYSATAKLINKGTSSPPAITDKTKYGGYYWAGPSNPLPFIAYGSPSTMTVT